MNALGIHSFSRLPGPTAILSKSTTLSLRGQRHMNCVKLRGYDYKSQMAQVP